MSTPDIPEPVPYGRGRLENVSEFSDLEEVEVNGVVIHTARVSPQAKDLPPAEFAERLLAHAERIGSGEEALAAEVARHKPAPRTTPQHHRPMLPDHLDWLDLKVVDCRLCRRTLLGPSDEPLRAACAGLACHGHLPPPVGGGVAETHYLGSVPQVVRFFVCKRCAAS